MRRTLMLLSTMVLAISLAGGLALVALSPAARADVDCQPSGSEVVCTFTYTGAAQSWTVPEGVTQATFEVSGAQGGWDARHSAQGGVGGMARATIDVTPDDTLQVNVGGAGADGVTGPPNAIVAGGAGGFNGGAAGGSGSLTGAGGGGGASDIRTGAFALAERIIVAGGGGGVGVHNGGAGGAGGGIVGGDGNPALGAVTNGQGGKGGTATSGGEGGAGAGTGGPGETGSLGVGGRGGSDDVGGGGGGGGGYYGGGGGGAARQGGGGGGGSGFVDPQASNVQFQSGVRGGNGLVTITYTSPNSPPTAIDDSYTTNQDTPLTVAAPGVLGNDTDPDSGDTLTAVLVSGPSHAATDGFTLNQDGSFNYTPASNFNGSDSFTYKANDGTADSGVATVSITVNPVNDAPTIEVVGGPDSTCLSPTSARTTLKITDVDNDPSSLTLSATSSNPALLPNTNVTFAGSGDTRTATFTTISTRASSTVEITVSDGQAEATTTVNVQAGGSGTDNLIGTNDADILLAQSGDDTLSGLDSSDVLCGATGNDNLTGGEGADHLGGGSGNDTLTGGLGADHFGGDTGTDTATDFNLGEGDTRSSTE
jgi:hypothetical protein